jgi:lactoylglutathione lyase
MTITSIGHVALRCRDLDESIKFYGSLGIPEAYRITRPDGKPGPVFLKVAPGSFLELFAGGTEELDSSPAKPGLVHLCLHVSDIHAFHANALAHGISTGAEPAQRPGGNWVLNIIDPTGIRLEIIQLVPGTPMANAAV